MHTTPLPGHLLVRPFTSAQARAAGVSRDVLRGARFRRLFRGVYASVELAEEPALFIAGALVISPAGSFAMLFSAGHLLQLRWRASTGWRTAVGRRCAGLPATDPVSTFLDHAAFRRLPDAVVIGDALVRRGLVTCEQLVEAATRVPGEAGLRASRAAAYVRPGVDSPMETLLRLLIVLAGLPEPTVNQDVHSAGGYWLARPDLSWPRVRVSVEYDGIHHFADPDGRQRRRDIRRRAALADSGWIDIVVMSEDLRGGAWEVLERIRRVQAQRRLPGVPESLDRAWREVGASLLH